MSDLPPAPPPSGGPPPGWYPDPYGQPGYRWWNGVAWTDDRAGPEGGGRNRLLAVGDMLGETFRVLGQRIGHLFTLAAVLLLGPSVLASVALYLAIDDLVYEDGDWSGISAGRLAVVGLSGIVAAVSHLVFIAAVNRQGMAAVLGAPEPWSASLAGGLRRALRVLGVHVAVWVPAGLAAIVALAVALVLSPAVFVLGLLALVVAMVVLWVRAGFLATAASVAPRGVGAIRTSFGLSKGHFWGLFGRFLLLVVLWWAINAGGSVATGPVASLTTSASEDAIVIDDDTGELLRADFGELIPANVGVLGFSLVVTALIQAAGSALSAVARVSLYRSLGGPVDESLTSHADPDAAPDHSGWSI